MTSTVTTYQKQFLRRLGHKDVSNLSKGQASELISKLLEEEKASGKTFPCPYCKARFGPRPRRQKKCKACGNTIKHLSGKFYTLDQEDEHYQKEWLKESKRDRKSDVKEDWREERKFRKEFGEPQLIGYMIKAGPKCPHVNKLNGLLVLIEDGNDTPDLLPPFDECRHDSCECEYDAVFGDEVPKRTRIAEWDDPAQQAKLKTRRESPQSIQKKSSGCASVFLSLLALISICSILLVSNK